MGHREDLLEGAKRCLLEKGWTRTTARDIVAASGANLASIGYHYGSKDALMTAAFLQMTEEWGEEIQRSLAAAGELGASHEQRLAGALDAMISGFAAHQRFWMLQFEVIGQLESNPTLKEALGSVMTGGREGMVAIFEGVPDTQVPAEATRTAGSVYHALFIGLWVQWLIAPGVAPSGADLVEGMRRIMTGTVLDGGGATR
jgi:AcrR family transcriptional regulator